MNVFRVLAIAILLQGWPVPVFWVPCKELKPVCGWVGKSYECLYKLEKLFSMTNSFSNGRIFLNVIINIQRIDRRVCFHFVHRVNDAVF